MREQSNTLAQRDLIATVLDMKVDSQLEMQRMSQRIGRIEDLLTELVKRLSTDSSGLSTPADDIPQVLEHIHFTNGDLVLIGFLLILSFQTTSISASETISSPTTVIAVPPPPINVTSVSSTPIQSIASTSGMQIKDFSLANHHCSFNILCKIIISATGIGPLLLRKRRSKARKAPPPPIRVQATQSEQTRLLEEIEATDSAEQSTSAGGLKSNYFSQ